VQEAAGKSKLPGNVHKQPIEQLKGKGNHREKGKSEAMMRMELM